MVLEIKSSPQNASKKIRMFNFIAVNEDFLNILANAK